MQGIWILSQELDVLDASVFEALHGGLPFAGVERGTVTFEREQETAGRVRYHFTNVERGDVGGLILQKRPQGCTLTAFEPAMRYRAKVVKGSDPRLLGLEGDARDAATMAIIGGLQAEENERHKQARDLHTHIMQRTLSRMNYYQQAYSAPEPASKPEPAKQGPTAETSRRAEMFRSLKDNNPRWSYAKVAKEATRSAQARAGQGEKPPTYKADNVRNAYRAMGWKWERANQIR